MSVRFVLVGFAILGVLAALGFIQIIPDPGGGASDSVRGPAVAPAGKVNLNSATASELRKLPRLSPGSAAAIIDSRALSRFRDWDDFAARRLVPSFTLNEIRDRVTF